MALCRAARAVHIVPIGVSGPTNWPPSSTAGGARPTKGPGYRALADRLRLLILDGRLPVDTVLPSERALAEAIGASRTTTTAAYRLLREEGFAHGSHGAGTWTALPASEPAGTPYPLAVDGLPGSPDGPRRPLVRRLGARRRRCTRRTSRRSRSCRASCRATGT